MAESRQLTKNRRIMATGFHARPKWDRFQEGNERDGIEELEQKVTKLTKKEFNGN